jgi:hypothetical protein
MIYDYKILDNKEKRPLKLYLLQYFNFFGTVVLFIPVLNMQKIFSDCSQNLLRSAFRQIVCDGKLGR